MFASRDGRCCVSGGVTSLHGNDVIFSENRLEGCCIGDRFCDRGDIDCCDIEYSPFSYPFEMEHGCELLAPSSKENDNEGNSLPPLGNGCGCNGNGINDDVDDPHIVGDREDILGEHDCCGCDVELLLEFPVAAAVVEETLKGNIVSFKICEYRSSMPSALQSCCFCFCFCFWSRRR